MKYVYKSRILYLISFIIISFCANLNATEFKQVIALDNLPQKDVQCLFKDSEGFIWIGTLDGLYRYDGYDFKPYLVTKKKNSISSNMILALDEDTLGNIWISTYGEGVNKLNPKTGIFKHFSLEELETPLDNINLIVDDNNILWLGSWEGVKRIEFDSKMNNIQHCTSVFDTRVSTRALCTDSKGQLWIGAVDKTYVVKDHNYQNITCDTLKYGCFSLFPSNDKILHGKAHLRKIQTHKDSTGLDNYNTNIISYFSKRKPRYLFKMIETPKGVWVGTRKGVWQYKYTADESLILNEIFDKKNSEGIIKSNIIKAILEDNNENIWVGTRGGGLNIIKDNPKKFKHFTSTKDNGSLSNNFTKTIFIDSENELWIGTESGGVNRIALNDSVDYNNDFKHYEINSQRTANRVYAIEEIQTPLSHKQERLIFFGTSHPVELATMNPATNEIKKVSYPKRNFGFVFCLKATSDTTLWVGTYYNGLWRLTLDKNGEVINSKQFTSKSPKSSISSNIIRHIEYDSKGNLWVSTDKGVNILSPIELQKNNPTFIQYNTNKGLPFNYILQIYESKNQKIWMGSMGGGLIEVCGDNIKDLQFKQYTTQNCLANNAIKGIQEDKQGNLWISSNKGLSRFSPTLKCCVNYDINDGLQDNEYSEICSNKLKNGQLIFGGRNGFNIFYPEQINDDTIPPKLFLSHFYLFDKKIKPGDTINGRILLDQEIQYKRKLTLKHYENNFSIGFVGLQYNSPQKNNYKYQLEGFDQSWIISNSKVRLAKYTNLDPGDYTFKMTAANSDGYWNNEILEFDIEIIPPFWARWYFKLIILLLTFLLIFSYIKYRTFYLEKQKTMLKRVVRSRTLELQKANKELKEANDTKDKFFSIVAHDLRSPVNGFLGLTKLMDSNFENLEHEKLRHFVHVLAKSAKSMFGLLENLLYWARLQQDKYHFLPKEIQLNQTVQETLEGAQELASKKDINLSVNINPNLKVYNDEFVINMTIRNLLSNAIKFTPKGGEVKLSAYTENNRAIVAIKDSGIGMNNEIKNNLFDQSKDTHRIGTDNEPSSGLGLVLCKEFITKSGGELWVESQEGKGSTFFFSSALA